MSHYMHEPLRKERRLCSKTVARGVGVNVLNMGKADNSPMGKLMTTILLAFAEFERDLIVERTTAGKAVAKEKDPEWREGRKAIELPDFEKFLEKQKGVF